MKKKKGPGLEVRRHFSLFTLKSDPETKILGSNWGGKDMW